MGTDMGKAETLALEEQYCCAQKKGGFLPAIETREAIMGCRWVHEI